MRNKMNIDQGWNRTSNLLAAALLVGLAAVAGAQEATLSATNSHWAPWVGCWQASGRDAEALNLSPGSQTPSPIVCVVPTAGGASVDLVTVTGNDVGTPERVDANGTRRAVTREGCDGWETAEFSPNGKRIYVRSEFACSGNRTRTSSGIMSISPNGEWLDVQGVKVEANNGVRVVHYGHVPVPATLPAEMKAALEGNKMATATAMLAASDSLQIADVVEATKQVDPLVVQTWLAERGQGFALDARKLSQLADAGVAPNVIDLMVALSYPRAFAINLAQSNGQIVPTEQTRANAEQLDPRNDTHVVFMNSWDPFYSGYGSFYGYGSYYGYRYGYPGYPGSWYYGNRPVVIITRPSGSVETPAAERSGRMVRGRGYTRPSDGSTGSTAGSPRGSTTSDRGSSSGGSSSTGSSSRGTTSSDGGSSSGRTAKPRSP